MTRREERLLLGEAAMLSVRRAAELLPDEDAEMRKLLESSGYVVVRRGKRRIRWGNALLAYEEDCESEKKPPSRVHTRHRRVD